MGRWIRTYWRGHVDWLTSVLLVLVGFRIAIYVVAQNITVAPMQPQLRLLVLLAFCNFGILIWQAVGAKRAIDNAGGWQGMRGALSYPCFSIAFGIFIFQELGRFAVWAAPSAKPSETIAALPVTSGTAILIGDITYTSYEQLLQTLDSFDIKTVQLNSGGGSIHAARAISKTIIDHKLNTYSNALCASACTLIFMAGNMRSLGPDGALGFHSYDENSPIPLYPSAPEEARDRDYLKSRGLDSDFIAKAYATPPDQLWRPTRAELRAAGAIKN